MMKNSALLIILNTLCFCAFAQSPADDIHSAAMKLNSFTTLSDGVENASWHGRVTITGKLYLDLDRSPSTPVDVQASVDAQLHFIPDAKSFKRLPSISGMVYPDKPKSIFLLESNLRDIRLDKFLDKSDVELIKREPYGHYDWRAALTLYDLQSELDGDARNFFSNHFHFKLLSKKSAHMDDPQALGP